MKHHTQTVVKGFSLVEMLVVIAVIGIIAAIAVPNVARINDRAKEAKNMRNAQNLASVYSSAAAAGYDFAYTDGDKDSGTLKDKAGVVAAVVSGIHINDSANPFNGARFSVQGLKIRDQQEAYPYLKMVNNELVYEAPATYP